MFDSLTASIPATILQLAPAWKPCDDVTTWMIPSFGNFGRRFVVYMPVTPDGYGFIVFARDDLSG
jgi:hypothetical protein